MNRGHIYADEFRLGDIVTLGERSRVVRNSPSGLVFATPASPGIEAAGKPDAGDVRTSFPLPVSAPALRVSRSQDLLAPEPAEPWRYARWASVDTETDGLGDDARIVEIAVVHMRFGLVEDAWSTLVNPGRPIPPEATAIHGITDAMVADAPRIEDVADEVNRRIADAAVTVAYNGYGFDEPLMRRSGIVFARPIIDALPLVREHAVSRVSGLPAKRWKSESERRERIAAEPDDDGPTGPWQWRRIGRHSLERASRELGQADPERGLASSLHRAAWDAVLTARVLWELRGWCQEDATTLEPRLRPLLARQNAANDAFMAEMRAKDAAKRPSPEARLAALLAEARDVVALLEGYADWRAGRPSPKTLDNAERTDPKDTSL